MDCCACSNPFFQFNINYYRSDHHLRPNFFRFFDLWFSLFNSR